MAVIDAVNGTVVPLHFPSSFTPAEIDKLGYTAAITLSWGAIAGAFVLIIGTRDWRKYSYTSLSIAWLLSVAFFAQGIFRQFGRFDHFQTFLAIAHIQVEWLIITYLLGYTFTQGYINASIVGLILTFGDLYFISLRPGFALTSILGGWGDVFIPLVLYNGGQKFLAAGAASHFLNALVTFVAFVYYYSVDLYLGLQVLAGSFYVFGTVVGILRLQAPAIRLEGQDESSIENGTTKLEVDQIISPPTREEVIKLGLIALVGSFAASIPLNFAPKP